MNFFDFLEFKQLLLMIFDSLDKKSDEDIKNDVLNGICFDNDEEDSLGLRPKCNFESFQDEKDGNYNINLYIYNNNYGIKILSYNLSKYEDLYTGDFTILFYDKDNNVFTLYIKDLYIDADNKFGMRKITLYDEEKSFDDKMLFEMDINDMSFSSLFGYICENDCNVTLYSNEDCQEYNISICDYDELFNFIKYNISLTNDYALKDSSCNKKDICNYVFSNFIAKFVNDMCSIGSVIDYLNNKKDMLINEAYNSEFKNLSPEKYGDKISSSKLLTKSTKYGLIISRILDNLC